LKSFNDLSKSVEVISKDSQTLLVNKDTALEFIGSGRSAFVFRIQPTDKVIKVFYPPFTRIAEEEAHIYRTLEGIQYYPKLYDAGANYLVIDHIDGNTLFNCLIKGIKITNEIVEEVEHALMLARERGLNPSDIHLRNILLTPEGSIKIIDVARFRQNKDCNQWNDLKTAFHTFYSKPYFPKSIPICILNTIAFFYKKRLIPTIFINSNLIKRGEKSVK
jgi:predicted Ser/Thr protein kinase